MKRLLAVVAVAGVSLGIASFGMAEEKKQSGAANPGKPEGHAEAAAAFELRAEVHRTLVLLNEARAAEKPDPVKLQELTGKLRQLRGQLRGQSSAAANNAADGWVCPWGRPSRGLGGWCGGPGGGRGRGAGFGPGRGWGGGAGGGRGLGPGAGQGRAPGGAAFIDQDEDGVCDRFEQSRGTQK